MAEKIMAWRCHAVEGQPVCISFGGEPGKKWGFKGMRENISLDGITLPEEGSRELYLALRKLHVSRKAERPR